MFELMKMAPNDPVLGLSEIYKNDKRLNKINLGIGVYTDTAINAPILISVKNAETLLLEKETNKNYLSIEGMELFNRATQSLLFGETNSIINENRIRTVQSIGGTGALRIITECISKNSNVRRKIWISNPSWINHQNIFLAAGLEIRFYPYYDQKTHAINFDELLSTLNQTTSEDLVLLHGCCHNPTGMDFSIDQWKILSEHSDKNGWVPLFDLAYQGFGYDLLSDLIGIHIFCKKIPELIVCNSYSKNFGLYNERIGACTIIAQNDIQAQKTLSQLKSIIRANYSSPSCHGAAIVSTILMNSKLRAIWEDELENMRNRINNMRELFLNNLQNTYQSHSTQDFSFIKNQRGMFSFIGLNSHQVLQLRERFGIYLVGSGRLNLAGLSNENVKYVCTAIHSLFIDNK